MARKKSQIAAQLYTLRDFLRTPEDMKKTFRRLREIGYLNVQVSGLGPIEPPALRGLLDEAGLAAIGSHDGIDIFRRDLRLVIAKLQTLGCRHVAIPYLQPEERGNAEAWRRLALEMTGYGRDLAKEGLVLQYHNHDFEFQRFDGRIGLEILFAESDPAMLQAELDTAWIARSGADPVDWILRLKGRLDQIHIKDVAILEGQGPVFAEIGEGNLHWAAVLKACRKAGVKTYIVEQDACPVTQDPFRSLAISLANLKAMGLS